VTEEFQSYVNFSRLTPDSVTDRWTDGHRATACPRYEQRHAVKTNDRESTIQYGVHKLANLSRTV